MNKIKDYIKEIEKGCGEGNWCEKGHICRNCKAKLQTANDILKLVGEVNRIEQAEQQFTGFAMGSQMGDIEELINSMALKEKEWMHLKSEEMVNCLSDEQIKEVDKYFNLK